ncbi:MAG: ribonuclease P protein component [Burkholderiales bacterium]|nr:ribonuclease P protein component [Betaproteobacteria bacterium]
MQAGLGRWRRIASAATFKQALATRPRARGPFFDVLCLNPDVADRAGSRLGLVVAKRICRSAVARNRAKRLIRESFRLAMPAEIPIDCVVRLRRCLAPADLPAARCELSAHWRTVCAR